MQLHALGELRLEDSDFQRVKPLLLLTYLALEGRQERSFLARLFWPSMEGALDSLSTTLGRLRKVVPHHLEADPKYLATSVPTDAHILEQAFGQKDWQRVIELYKGPFLRGIETGELNPELEEWVYSRRETYAAKTRQALIHIAWQEAECGRFETAAQLALRAYELPQAPELELEDLERMYVLLEAGQHPRARDVRKEASTLGSTLNLSHPEARRHLNPHKTTLPIQTTLFIGRESEKQQLAQMLSQPYCRLITLVAPGGMGKTRLALEVAQAHSALFADGVCFVSFASTATADLMSYTLAEALKVRLVGQDPPHDQMLEYLQDKTMLLVMDNLEHLLTGMDFINDILTKAPQIKILATSRERLGLQSEHLFEPQGLKVPELSNPDAKGFDSLLLFTERARHNKFDFDLEENLQAVARICQLVGGMPLALELAASWSRILAPEAIVQELQQGLDILVTSSKDLPERHHNMRSVFEASWQRLSEAEQTALRRLSVFHEGFTREAALNITGTSLPELANLVDKAFLNIDADYRYFQHPLLLEYCRAKLAQNEEEFISVLNKHGRFFFDLFKWQPPNSSTTSIFDPNRLNVELANFRAAWAWAAQNKNAATFRQAITALWQYINYHDLYAEGLLFVDQAISVLDRINPDHHAALGNLYILKGSCKWGTANLREGEHWAIRGLEFLRLVGDQIGIEYGLSMLGAIFWRSGDYKEANQYCLEGLSIAKNLNYRLAETLRHQAGRP